MTKRPHEAAPTAFSASWLQQREPFDAVARTAAAARLALAARLATLRPEPATPWRVIDLACGTGANLRWLAPRLGGPQQWLVVDHDAALLRCWPAALESAACGAVDPAVKTTTPITTSPAKGGDPLEAPLCLQGPGYSADIVRHQLDLAQHLEALPWHAAHLVTASALLDLVSAHWLQRLLAAVASARVALLFALTCDGCHRWQPPDPADAVVAALFAAHQRRDKGFGPALGPRAAAVLLQALRGAGYRVHSARSDWRLEGRSDPRAPALQRAMVDGMAAAAREQEPAAAATVQGWQQRRRGWAAQGSLRVGHVDLLALPPRV